MMKAQLTSYDIKLFTSTLKEKFDVDFTDYANSFLRYRLMSFLEKWGISGLDTLLIKLSDNEFLLEKLLLYMSVETTEMFRDPGFWRIFVKDILRGKFIKKDEIKVLVPFITSDDELYTLLILLKEFGILEKTKITATSPFDVNIERTRQGFYPERKLELANDNYKRFTQKPESDLTHYFEQNGSDYIFSQDLLSQVRFLKSDIITNSFAKSDENFDLILFRNRMIYFNLNLQNKVLEMLFYHLMVKGFLVIGFKENIHNFVFIDRLKQIDKSEKIFMKTK